jgi:hypothetical protein
VIVAVPAATPVTTPPATVATAVLFDVQVTTRFVTIVPFRSFTVTVSVVVDPARMFAVAGETVTLPTGAGVTVTIVDPGTPSLIAVIVALPGATAVTTPVAETVAATGLFDDHVTTRSVTTVPFTSRTMALSCTFAPTVNERPCGCTATEPTATFVVVTFAVPLFPSLVAVIVATPFATALTRPCDETVAAAGFELDHATARPVRRLPAESASVAVSCVVCPTDIESGFGVTATVATAGCETTIVAVPLAPSAVAVIVADPEPAADITPFESTVATAALLVLQMTARPARTLCVASYVTAESCVRVPGVASTCGGVTTTLATGVLATVIVATPDLPFAFADTWVEPSATPVTTPSLETVAMLVFSTDQKMSVPATGWPLGSWMSA